MAGDAHSRWRRIDDGHRPERLALRWPAGPQSPSPGAAGPIFFVRAQSLRSTTIGSTLEARIAGT